MPEADMCLAGTRLLYPHALNRWRSRLLSSHIKPDNQALGIDLLRFAGESNERERG